MKIRNLILLVFATAFGLVSCNNGGGATQTAANLKTQIDSASYYIGYANGKQLSQMKAQMEMQLNVKINSDLFLAGINAALKDQKAPMELMKIEQFLRTFFQEKMKAAEAERQAKAEKAKKEGETFLAENAKKKDVKTTKSGLQYKIVKEGKGATPTAQSTVKVHYKGTLLDGTEFDSSYKRNEPATFPVGGVIRGWTEALQMMPVGSKWILYIPANLAYGEFGQGSIGPNEVLTFEVELLDIVDPKANK